MRFYESKVDCTQLPRKKKKKKKKKGGGGGGGEVASDSYKLQVPYFAACYFNEFDSLVLAFSWDEEEGDDDGV